MRYGYGHVARLMVYWLFFFFFFLPLHRRTILHLASFFHTPHFYSIECLFCILHFRVAKILQYQSE